MHIDPCCYQFHAILLGLTTMVVCNVPVIFDMSGWDCAFDCVTEEGWKESLKHA